MQAAQLPEPAAVPVQRPASPALAPALRTISGETPHYRARFEVAAADGADAAEAVKEIVMGWLHAKGFTALKVLEYLKIDPSKTRLALIMNADSHLYGTKDIIKIEDEENVDLDVLGLVARQATVGIVRGGKIVRKLKPTLPEHVVNIITCVNPRCVTTTERGIDQMFHLVHSQRQE